MEIHILNGDALAKHFYLDGEVVVMRECLMEGPVLASTYKEFWKMRERFLGEMFHAEEVREKRDLETELEKLKSVETASAINLWFDHDLFCQVNMWFVVDFISNNNIQIPLYRVMPSPLMTNIWSGFGNMNETDLRECYEHRLSFSDVDVRLCVDLWNAYRTNDLQTLAILASKQSPCFPFLGDAVNAHIERFPRGNGRPERRLREILNEGKKDFNEVFGEFWKTEGVYGFGDLQVKDMLESLDQD